VLEDVAVYSHQALPGKQAPSDRSSPGFNRASDEFL
jgi:hypothetical protein